MACSKHELPQINSLVDTHDFINQLGHRETGFQIRPTIIQLIHFLAVHFGHDRLPRITQEITARHAVRNRLFLIQILCNQFTVKSFCSGVHRAFFQRPQYGQSRQANSLDKIRIRRFTEKIASYPCCFCIKRF